ncbi:MAG: cysteine synthase family protein [Methanomassiliicoccales archaeon]
MICENEFVRNSILESIGNTPLLRLHVPGARTGVSIYGKAEWFNPGGSVKDRAALRIITEAEKRGEMNRERTLLDASSGNTAIAYALVCAAKGYRCTMVVPRNVSASKIAMLRAYGAELVLSDPLEGTDGAQRLAKEMAKEDHYYYADQYNNQDNWKAHYYGTAPEIVSQLPRFDCFVAGVGTGGTFTGIARYLNEHAPEVARYAVQPSTPLHGLEGLKHMSTSIRPGIYDERLAEDTLYVDTEDAQRMLLQMAKQGLLLGPSSGAALVAARELSKKLDSGNIVTVLPDNGQRYLGETFWRDIL